MKQKVIYIKTSEAQHKAASVAATLENTNLAELGRTAIQEKIAKLAKKHPALGDLIQKTKTEPAAA